METKTLGKLGEDAACEFLMRSGHTLISRNRRESHLEIDIISIDGEGLHFVEVKCRRAPAQADPEENVGYKKQMRLVRAAKRFLHSDKWKSSPYSKGESEIFFDVVSVLVWPDRTEINYFPRAFLPMFF